MMARPDLHVELGVDGQWQDITTDVKTGETVTVNRGRRDWASVADPATATLQLNQGPSNVAPGIFGRYAPRNPVSDLYGLIGRNTPMRVRVGPSSPRLRLPGFQGSAAILADVAGFDFTDGLDVAIDLAAPSWPANDGHYRFIVGQWTTDQGNWSWMIDIGADGTPWFSWSSDGTASGRQLASPDVTLPVDSGRVRLRVQLQTDIGGGEALVTFYTRDSDADPWTVLGVPYHANAADVFTTDTWLTVGVTGDGRDNNGRYWTGEVFSLRILDGAAAVAVDADFTELDPTADEFTDGAGNLWGIEGFAAITDPSVRLSGEVAHWPQAWDLSGRVRWSSVTSAGILRRLQRHTAPIRSSLYRDLSTKANVVAYWPLEEPEGAARFASGRAGDTSTLRTFGDVTLAGYDAFDASEAVPTVAAGNINGALPSYVADDDQRFVFLTAVSADGIGEPEDTDPTETIFARWYTTGTLRQWDLIYGNLSGGILGLRVYDDDGNVALEDGSLGGINGAQLMVSLWLQRRGSSTFYQLAKFEVGTGGAFIFEGTVSGSYGRFSHVYLGSTNDVQGTPYGHAALMNGDVHSVWDTIRSSLVAWSGEEGARRLWRLGVDEGIPVRIRGGDTSTMGPQRPLTVLELMREVGAADFGVFGDARDAVAVDYRPRATLYGQRPALVIDFAGNQISEPFQPTEDDQATVNAVTVTNVAGDSVTLEVTDGPLSTAPPPAGVGRYDTSLEVNVDGPSTLPDIAGWALAIGTVEQARYPTVRLNLQHPAVAPLAADVLAVEEGDIIRVVNLPRGGPPGPADLIVNAIMDEIGPVMHHVEFTCAPGDPWTATAAYDVDARYDTGGAELAAAADADDTALSVATTAGPVWTTDPAELPIDVDVAGERVTVTAIDGATSPQTFTVTRGVNGVVKAHGPGAPVRLADPTRYAL